MIFAEEADDNEDTLNKLTKYESKPDLNKVAESEEQMLTAHFLKQGQKQSQMDMQNQSEQVRKIVSQGTGQFGSKEQMRPSEQNARHVQQFKQQQESPKPKQKSDQIGALLAQL